MASIQKTLRMYEFIKRYHKSNQTTPPIREIGLQFGMRSTASVHHHLKVMEEKGWIKRPRYSHSIEIVEQEHKHAA